MAQRRTWISVGPALSIFLRGSRWSARAYVLGRRIQEPTGFHDAQAAAKWALDWRARLERQAAGIEIARDPDLTPEDLVDAWAAELRRQQKTPRDVDLIVDRVRQLVAGTQDLVLCTPDWVTRRLAWVAETPVKKLNGTLVSRGAATVNKYRSSLRRFFAWLVRTEKWGRNPVDATEPVALGEKDRERRALPLLALRALLEVAPLERRVCYLLASTCGLRRGEMRALLWSGLVLETPGASLCVRRGTAKNRREVWLPMPQVTVDALVELRAERVAGRATSWPRRGKPANLGWRPSESVVIPPLTSTLRVDLAAAAELLKKRGLDPSLADHQDHGGGVVDFHALRGTYSTLLKDTGASLQVAQTLMRHSDPRLTANVYTTIWGEELRQAVDKVGARIEPATNTGGPAGCTAPRGKSKRDGAHSSGAPQKAKGRKRRTG